MEFQSFQRRTPTINLSALIDVVFILVIFIVLAANFDRIRNLDVTLPEAEATASEAPDAVAITIREGGAIEIGDEIVSRDEVQSALESRGDPDDPVLILADGNVAFERAVWVLGEASAAGFRNVSIATRREAE